MPLNNMSTQYKPSMVTPMNISVSMSFFTGGVIDDHTPLTISRNEKQEKSVIRIFHPQRLPKRNEK